MGLLAGFIQVSWVLENPYLNKTQVWPGLNPAINTRVISIFKSSRPELFCEKGVVRNFTKFTWKHLCQSLLFNKVAGVFHRTPLVAASVFFQSILLVLTKFSSWQENWSLAYDSMIAVRFLWSKPLGGSKFTLSSF